MIDMKALYTLCYPKLSVDDRKFVDDFRNQHDIPYRDVVAPHFTLVFGCSDVPLDKYKSHVEAVADSQKEISFNCRYAMLHNDDSNDNYYVFLVPDNGYAEISKLHDKLYSGKFAPFLRLDIPYVPHIGIATIPDASLVKQLCDGLNSEDLNISGHISSLTVSEYDGSKITDIEHYRCSE